MPKTKVHIIRHNHIRRRKAKMRIIAVTAIAATAITALSVAGAYTYADYKITTKGNDYYTACATVESITDSGIIFATSDGNMWAYAGNYTDVINGNSECRILFNGNFTNDLTDDEIITFWEVD